MTGVVHHIELWTTELERSAEAFDWLLTQLGWRADSNPDWPQGRIWRSENGPYLVLEASPAVTGSLDRLHAGLNHLALRVGGGRAELDRLRAECGRYGWTELFGDRYPHAGGPEHTALFLENREGFEIELVSG